MLRQIHTFLGLTKLEPKKVIQNRIHLQVKQKQNINKTAQLPSDQTFLDLPLKQLQEKACQERFGSFVSRCADPFHQNLKFLADINLDKALNENSSGIPYTTKDQINTQDLVTTCGFSHRIVPCNYNAQIVELLSKHGCVPYAHTNIPQGLLNIQTNNKVYGQSLNPYKRGFISGGSSGGDAVAVATRCASFSIGSDTAGSIRIPAAFCGVVGFKPTGSKRLSVKGRVGVTGNQSPSIKDLDTSLGFLTRSVDDVEWLCQKTIGKSIKPNPYLYGQWNSAKYEESKKSKKTFGYMVQNDQIQCAPSIKNCIQQSCEKLEKQGHTVVQFKFPELYKFRNFVFKALKNTQFLNAMLKTKGQQNENQQSWWLYERARYGKIGNLVRKILAANIRPQTQAYDIFNIGNSTADLLKAVAEKDQIKNKFLDQWQDKKIDALLTPVMPFNALKTNSNQYLVLLLTFCCFQNVLQMPSGSVPTRFVKASETDAYNDNGFYGSKVMNSLKSSQGLPVGIQVTTKHLEDQVCVGAMWQLEQIWGKMAKPKKWQ